MINIYQFLEKYILLVPNLAVTILQALKKEGKISLMEFKILDDMICSIMENALDLI